MSVEKKKSAGGSVAAVRHQGEKAPNGAAKIAVISISKAYGVSKYQSA